MLSFNHAGLRPAGPEVLRAMNAAVETFGTLLYCDSGIAWYCKQAKECKNKIAELLHTGFGHEGIRWSCVRMRRPR